VDDDLALEAYKLLRTRVLKRLEQNQWNVIGVCSAAQNEGKTLTSVNLAVSIARKLNYTSLLVDADLRRPSVSSVLGIKPKLGIEDHLLSGAPLKDVFINPGIDRMVVLPCRHSVESMSGNASEILAAPRMAEFVNEIKNRYKNRIVVFDLPPVLVGDDVVAFAHNLDALLMVVEEGGSRSDEVTHALRLLEGVELLGVVLNKSSATVKGYGYYY
jgi:capsular exopolysaccharide synthesis family protein